MAEESFSISFSTKGMWCNAGLCLSPPLALVSTRHCGTLYLAYGACHEQSDCQERRRNNQKQRHQGFPEHDSVTFLFKMSEISYGRSTVVARASPASSMRREVKRLGFLVHWFGTRRISNFTEYTMFQGATSILRPTDNIGGLPRF